MSDEKKILNSSRVVAVVGLSPKPDRPSHQVARYLKKNGYKIIPVNPKATEILGEVGYIGEIERTADVRALTRVEVLRFDYKKTQERPEVFSLYCG